MNATRRGFLRGGAALVGASALPFAPLPALASGGGYKALVCVMLVGGLDGHDTVIPADASGYADWSASRAGLLEEYDRVGALASRERGGLAALGASGFGLPGEMAGLADLYGAGDLAVLANVGPLMGHGTKNDHKRGLVPTPPRLMSHNDQRSLWQSLAAEGALTGWGGGLIEASREASPFSAISVSGQSTFLTGRAKRGFEVDPSGDMVIRTIRPESGQARSVKDVMREHYLDAGADQANLFARDVAEARSRAVGATLDLQDLLEGKTAGDGVVIEGNDLSVQLAMVAKLISERGALSVNRQIFYCTMSGFDTHEAQAERLPALQASLTEALVRFQAEMARQGRADSVTTFTASDFGRSLSPNAKLGTNHGWGGHHFAMGGAVRGGQMLGEMAPPVLRHEHDWGAGRLVPTTAIESYAAALGRWFGVGEGDLRQIFPRLPRFDADRLALF